MVTNLSGIGQNLGQSGQVIGQIVAKKRLSDLMKQLNSPSDPVQGPPLPGVGLAAASKTPSSGLGANPPPFNGVDQGKLMSLMTQLYPDVASKMLQDRMDPLKQAQTAYYQRRAGLSGGPNGPGPGKRTVYENADGTISLTPQEGSTPMVVSDSQAMQYTATPKSSRFKADQKNIQNIESDWKEVRKVVNPFRSTGIGGASSVFNKAAVANQAAARGLKILRKPTLTWQELNAYVNSDIASIQRGGTPTDIQLHEANYNTLLGKLGAMKTYATGKPATDLVPDETRKQIEQNILDIIGVDNQIIDDGIGYAEQAYPEAIAAHQGTWQGMKNAAMKIKTVGESASPIGGQKSPPSAGGWSYVGPVQ